MNATQAEELRELATRCESVGGKWASGQITKDKDAIRIFGAGLLSDVATALRGAAASLEHRSARIVVTADTIKAGTTTAETIRGCVADAMRTEREAQGRRSARRRESA